MPGKMFAGIATFKRDDEDTADGYQYVYENGKLECSKIVGEIDNKYRTEPAEMKRMTEEEKQYLLNSTNEDCENEK